MLLGTRHLEAPLTDIRLIRLDRMTPTSSCSVRRRRSLLDIILDQTMRGSLQKQDVWKACNLSKITYSQFANMVIHKAMQGVEIIDIY